MKVCSVFTLKLWLVTTRHRCFGGIKWSIYIKNSSFIHPDHENLGSHLVAFQSVPDFFFLVLVSLKLKMFCFELLKINGLTICLVFTVTASFSKWNKTSRVWCSTSSTSDQLLIIYIFNFEFFIMSIKWSEWNVCHYKGFILWHPICSKRLPSQSANY